jgi:hypothetical protein
MLDPLEVHAQKVKASLVVFLFGHGEEFSHVVCIEDSELTIEEFQGARADGGDTTIVSTACYSGGWAVTPLLNTTTIAATDDCSESLSFPKSGSIGRFCGGLFASAIIDNLVGESSPLVGPTTEQDTIDSSMQQEEPKKTEMYVHEIH